MFSAPKDDVIRAVFSPGVEFRSEEPDSPGLMTGHLAVFSQWTEIASWYEGNFMERLAPGCFKKTISENLRNVKVLYDHGYDPQLGNKPLGSIEACREDAVGCYYEVKLLDADYVRELVPALRAGLLGASFRFRVVQELINDDPGASPHNPKGLPERSITEVKLMEFGPVTFPAYAAATAGVRGRREFDLWQNLDEEGRSDFARLLVRARDNDAPAVPESNRVAETPADEQARQTITINIAGAVPNTDQIIESVRAALDTTDTEEAIASDTVDNDLRTSEEAGDDDTEVRTEDVVAPEPEAAPITAEEPVTSDHSSRLANSAAWRIFLLEEEGVI
jgi:HK97 family phage prohead protease